MIDHATLPDMSAPMPDGPEPIKGEAAMPAALAASADATRNPALAALAEIAADLLKMGFAKIADWIQNWIAGSTRHSSLSDVRARAGTRLLIDFYGCDDEAYVAFNGEMLARKQLDDPATRHRSGQPIRRGLNYLVIGVDNNAAHHWSIAVDAWEEGSNRHLARAVFDGDDGFATNTRIYTCRIEGV